MKLGGIAFEGNHSKDFAHGRFVENTIGNGIVSHVFKVLRPRLDFDLDYWKYAINNELIMYKVLMRSTKAAPMMHELVTNDFLNERIPTPNVDEQGRIGSFFSSLDHLITLHQRKCKNQFSLKYFVENTYSQEVSRRKSIDLPNSWEQRKLGECGFSYSGLSGKKLILVMVKQDISPTQVFLTTRLQIKIDLNLLR